ncbi:MAG: serine/threonine-protein kinase [Anaerolineales bacterium]|nr:serine/threonine-protein kinase [Chloroflexota bacterium]MBL6980947.1 serine/threonine-protein kinase [Anaerolineales bacterium]
MLGEIVFDKYKLEEQIGEDNTKTLYRGVNVETKRIVIVAAIRSLLVPLDEFLARYKENAEQINQIESPYAIFIEEFGESNGQIVVVQSNLAGQSLSEILADSEGLPINIVLDIAQQMGEFLTILHRIEMSHGDINADSIILGSDGVVRFANPGIAAALGLGRLISDGRVDPQPYHAPELREGGSVETKTDIYALGATIYEMLTGKAPEIYLANPSPEHLRVGIPPELDDLVVRCLDANPVERISSAVEFLKGLEEVHQGMSVGAEKTILGIEDSLMGHTLGAYQLVERLGQGGMATVYKAFEPALDRYVAIKVLPQFFARDPNFMQRFRREAKAIAQLRHPNIVPIHSYGEDAGITYIAMQHVEGGSLDVKRGEALDVEYAVKLILPVAKALTYAHEQGIFHRDIKPGNVLLSNDDWPLLTDFGLAKIVESSTHLTRTGVGIGTPMYMSPEQGQGADVDHRTDIYSLGIMLYELVTGDVPFRANTPMAIVIKHITAPIPPPRTINPKIPEALERIILKATSKSPDNRYQSADEFALALEHMMSQITTQFPAKTSAALDDGVSSKVHSSTNQPAVEPPPIASMQINLEFLQRNWRKLALILIPVVILACLGGVFLMRQLFDSKQTSQLISVNITETTIPESALASSVMEPSQTPSDTPFPTSTFEPVITPEPTFTAIPTVKYLGGGSGQIAYASDRSGDVQIYLQNIEGDPDVEQLTDFPGGACQPAWSPDGSQLVFISPCPEQDERYPNSSLYLMDAESDDWEKISTSADGNFDPIWSPDGKQLAYTARDGSHLHIHIFTLADGYDISISDRLSFDMQPAWSPDGEQIVFLSTRTGENLLFVMTARGEKVVQFTRIAEKTNMYPRWSPDGNTILYMQLNNVGYPVLVSALFEKQGFSEQILTTEYTAPMRDPTYSPNGTWIAFSSNYDGSNHDIWIVTSSGTDPRQVVTDPAYDFDPAWRP